ncbi:MAG: hypothetical protein HYZ44_13630 [Bacteroidetes bacterium]|nr:hypothetical protein [Bacteroidota bacterium]
MEINIDVICQVYAGEKSKTTIDLVLNTFIPKYEKLNLDFASQLENEEYVFKTEDERINYFIENRDLAQTFYWNQYQDNPDKIMVGVNITRDNKLIVSLTFDGNEETEKMYFKKLKELLRSDIGVVSHIIPAEYDNGQDFVKKYG